MALAPPGRSTRGESLATSRMFRDAFGKQRCLIPVGNFYEWQSVPGRKHRQPYAVARRDGAPMALAGVWEERSDPDTGVQLRTFAIVTTRANDEMSDIQHRMPVVVEESDWALWLGETPGNPALLIWPLRSGVLRAWPVGPPVNHSGHDRPELLEPARLTEQTAIALR